MPKFIKEPVTQRQIDKWRRDSLRDGTRHASRAVGGVKYLYWSWENTERTQKEFWEFKYPSRIRPGKRQKMGLGACRDVTLADARELARRHLSVLNLGGDPVTERRAKARQEAEHAVKQRKFTDFVPEAIAIHTKGLRNAKNKAQWQNTIKDYCLPHIGDLYVSEIGVQHMTAILTQRVTHRSTGAAGPFWEVKNPTATKVRERMERILETWASMPPTNDDYRNPAELKRLQPMLPRIKHKPKHHPSLDYRECPKMFDWLRKSDTAAARCMQMIMLHIGRLEETAKLPWSELDFELKQWTLPPERTKSENEHVEPLSDQAIELLRSCEERHEHVWKKKGISETALRKLHNNSGFPGTRHGFRASFRTWGAEQAYPEHLLELCIAHTKDQLTRAYQRSDLRELRRKIMQHWADYLTGRT